MHRAIGTPFSYTAHPAKSSGRLWISQQHRAHRAALQKSKTLTDNRKPVTVEKKLGSKIRKARKAYERVCRSGAAGRVEVNECFRRVEACSHPRTRAAFPSPSSRRCISAPPSTLELSDTLQEHRACSRSEKINEPCSPERCASALELHVQAAQPCYLGKATPWTTGALARSGMSSLETLLHHRSSRPQSQQRLDRWPISPVRRGSTLPITAARDAGSPVLARTGGSPSGSPARPTTPTGRSSSHSAQPLKQFCRPRSAGAISRPSHGSYNEGIPRSPNGSYNEGRPPIRSSHGSSTRENFGLKSSASFIRSSHSGVSSLAGGASRGKRSSWAKAYERQFERQLIQKLAETDQMNAVLDQELNWGTHGGETMEIRQRVVERVCERLEGYVEEPEEPKGCYRAVHKS